MKFMGREKNHVNSLDDPMPAELGAGLQPSVIPGQMQTSLYVYDV
jgi:hypothetical protein